MPEGEGDCFVAGFNLAWQMGLQFEDVYLVHGIATGTGGDIIGQRYWHAWVEWQDVAFDQSNGNDIAIRKDEYHRIGQIENVKRYPARRLLRFITDAGHYGPWHDRHGVSTIKTKERT